MLVMRKVAQVHWQGKPEAFNEFWPLPDKYRITHQKVWGLTAEEAQATRDEVMRSHNIVLK